jgi:hypothetical protein
MNERQRFVDGEFVGRRYDYDDRTILAADFGVGVEGSVDLVGDTAIVVFGDDQYEFEVPVGTTTRASVNNGVLTIEVSRSDDVPAVDVGVEPETEDGSEAGHEVED